MHAAPNPLGVNKACPVGDGKGMLYTVLDPGEDVTLAPVTDPASKDDQLCL